MPKTTKKTVKKTTKKVVTSTVPIVAAPVVSTKAPMAFKPMNKKVLSGALIVVAIALLTYKAGPWLVPSIVDGHLVTRFELWSRLEKSYGAQTLDDLVNEKLLDNAIAKSGVKIDQTKVDAQLKSLTDQFTAQGGLDAALTQRGLTRADLIKQIKTQVAVETLLSDKITPTDAEVQKAFDDNAKTTYKDKKFDDVKASIIDQLKQSKLRDAFLTWFADVKKNAKVKTFGL
jgi:hypothetical protein